MILLDYFLDNNYQFLQSQSDNGYNELYVFFKDDIFYILTKERNIVFLELQYKHAKEKISIGYLAGSNDFLTEEEIIQLLKITDFTSFKNMSDSEIINLKKKMVNSRLKYPVLK